MNNIRTMEFLGEDFWGMLVYKCIETGILYKGEVFGDNQTPSQLPSKHHLRPFILTILI